MHSYTHHPCTHALMHSRTIVADRYASCGGDHSSGIPHHLRYILATTYDYIRYTGSINEYISLQSKLLGSPGFPSRSSTVKTAFAVG